MRAGAVLSRARSATAVGVALILLAACNSDDPEGGESTDKTSTAPVGSGTSADPAIDTDHAVDPPGPREDRLLYADLLVYNTEPLSEEMVEAISKLEGVADVEQLAMAQVPIENTALNVVAVDPGSYRLYTSRESADLQEQWDRVASGEVALTRSLKGKVPLDKDGFLRLGAGKEDPLVHVGAYAPQIPQVDVVVNEKWGEELGMVPGNALLVSTTDTAPQKVRKPIERLVGEDVSVQILAVDLDTSVQQTAVPVGSVADVVGVFNYTVIGGGRIAPEASWVSSHIATKSVPILGTVTCNRFLFPQLEAALQEIVDLGLADAIHPGEYAGCYYPRFIAGSTKLSNHSYGLALDLNVPGNQRGTPGEMDRTVVGIFKKWGFAWGGDWGYTDPMHFEMNQLVDPQVVSSKQ